MYKYTKGLRSLPRSFWYSVAFAVPFLGIYAGLAFSNYASAANPMPTDIALVLSPSVSLVIIWLGGKRLIRDHNTNPELLSLQRRLHFWVPLIFSIALFLQDIGNIANTYYDWAGIQGVPFWSMIAILAMYPFLLVGVLSLPQAVLGGKLPLRSAIDSFLLVIVMTAVSWYFLLGPLLLEIQRSPAPLSGTLAMSWVTFDLLIVVCLVVLSRSIVDQSLRRIIHALSLALIIFVLMDAILVYQGLHGSPDTTWISLGEIGGNFMVVWSLQAMRRYSTGLTMASIAPPQPSALVAIPIWRSLLVYALMPVVVGLIFSVWTTNRTGILAIGMYCCSLLLLIVIFLKQIVTIHEIHGFNRGFQRLQITIEEKNARLEALATTDPLTELPNHRALVTILDQELARSQQYQRSCSLLFFDLDHFKALNDGYGHAAGDTALCEFGSLLRAKLPLMNTIGRWGGEEFLAILPEGNASEAASIAEELRSAVANYSFAIGGGMHLTCSIGVASSPAHGIQAETLLQAADSAMYGAKRLGRNQVRLIDDPAIIALLATSAAIEGRDEVTLIGTVHALALLVEKRDTATGEHAQQVGEILLSLAQSLGFSEAEAQFLSLAGQLHDIGKIVIPDSVLQKQDALTEQEMTCIHQHPQVGAEVVNSIPSLRPLAPIIHAHHERWDGTGYPNQLAGDAIPPGARMLAIVDAYVVMMTESRCQDANGHEWALAELRRGAGTQFDPALVEQFALLLTPLQNAAVVGGSVMETIAR